MSSFAYQKVYQKNPYTKKEEKHKIIDSSNYTYDIVKVTSRKKRKIKSAILREVDEWVR